MSSRERTMLIVLGAIVVAGAAYFFLFVLGGEEPAQETAPTPVSSPSVPAGVGTAPPAEEPQAQPPQSVTFFGGRDPFIPLVEAETTDEGETTDGGTTDGTTDGGTTDGTTDGTSDGTTDGTTGSEDPTGDSIGVTGRAVVLTDVVDEEAALVEVEGVVLTVTEGQRFARNYQILSVEANCARFLYGDQPFTLCEETPPS